MRVINVLAAVAATIAMGGVATAKEKPADGDKKVCRTVMPAVGRIPAKRECRTKAEGEAATNASQRDAARAVEASTAR
jgi:hypothetical protein